MPYDRRMTPLLPSDQVKALAEHTEWSLAFRAFRTAHPTPEQVASLFDISPEDVRRAVAEDDSWLGYAKKARGSDDGLYVVRLADGTYETYEQERGVAFSRRRWRTLSDAREVWVEHLIWRLAGIRSAGTTRHAK